MRFLLAFFFVISRACFAVTIKEDFESKLKQFIEKLAILAEPTSLKESSALDNVFSLAHEIHDLIAEKPKDFIKWYGKEPIKNVYQILDELSVFGHVSSLISQNKLNEIANLTWVPNKAEKIIYGGKHNAQEQLEKVRSATYRYEQQYLEKLKHHKTLSPINRQFLFLNLALQKMNIDSLPTKPYIFSPLKYTLKLIKGSLANYSQSLNIIPSIENRDELIQVFSQDLGIIYLL